MEDHAFPHLHIDRPCNLCRCSSIDFQQKLDAIAGQRRCPMVMESTLNILTRGTHSWTKAKTLKSWWKLVICPQIWMQIPGRKPGAGFLHSLISTLYNLDLSFERLLRDAIAFRLFSMALFCWTKFALRGHLHIMFIAAQQSVFTAWHVTRNKLLILYNGNPDRGSSLNQVYGSSYVEHSVRRWQRSG